MPNLYLTPDFSAFGAVGADVDVFAALPELLAE